MVARLPLVDVAGVTRELPTGDTLPAAFDTSTADIRGNVSPRVVMLAALWDALKPVPWGTISGTYTPDMNTFLNSTATVTANLTLANPSNAKPGQGGQITLTMNAANLTISYGTAWKAIGGTTPTAPTTSGARCIISYFVNSSTDIPYSLTPLAS